MASEPIERAKEIVGRLGDRIGDGDATSQSYVAALRDELQAIDREGDEAGEQLRAYAEAYEKLVAPANRIGVFLRVLSEGTALVGLGDTEYVAQIDPKLTDTSLEPGARVRLNEAYAVVGVVDSASVGAIIKVGESLEDGRLRVGGDVQGQSGRVIERAAALSEIKILVGDEVRLDATGRLAVEHFGRPGANDYFVEEVPETPWSAIGGQQNAISLIREVIEQPLLFPEIYRRFDKKPVKGVLLYGPPGCGKTMIGKAIAYNLAKEYSARLGHEVKECFLHISGSKILNMWLGESERIVREIFATARERAKEGQLVVVFIDEAESILRTRSSGRWLNISNTVVPQFCAEMDGLVELENVVIVLTSNRPDYIDPAILRPERIDRKVKIERPDRDATREILGLYLHEGLPLDAALVAEHIEPECARVALIESTMQKLWSEEPTTEFVRVFTRSGTNKVLRWRDFVSGALLKSVVDRAKDTAIRRAIADGGTEGSGIRVTDMIAALESEYNENEIFPKGDAADDWIKLLDVDAENVVSVKPVRGAIQPPRSIGRVT